MATFDLDQIDPNPYQARETEDLEHIKKLADSIARDGLMQIPIGRKVGDRVELAFGHSRLAAYRLLRNGAGTPSQFDVMPVMIRDLSDVDMFRLSISENLARKDLTPIEEARAMERYRDEFGKTSAEIGALFGLSDSAVRNKMRLLHLPEGIQAELANSKVPELALREILSLLDLPEEIRKKAEGFWDETIKPSQIIRDSLGGENAEATHQRISKLLTQRAIDLSAAPWKFDDEFPNVENVHGPCKTCADRIQRDKKNFCAGAGCYKAKEAYVQRLYIVEAAQESGIPPFEGEETGNVSEFGFHGDQKLAAARSINCPNLRLIYRSGVAYEIEKYTRLESFPQAEIICTRRRGTCTCQKATDAGIEIAPASTAAANDLGAPGDSEKAPTPSPVITAEDLKGIDRQIRAKKKEDMESILAMEAVTANEIATALIALNPVVWRRLVHDFIGYVEAKPTEIQDQDLILGVSRELTNNLLYEMDTYNPDEKEAFAILDNFLRSAGLEGLKPPEGIEHKPAPPEAGKPLFEVFGEIRCKTCGTFLERQVDESDGFVWLHCPKCDTYTPEEGQDL